jgi:hypothetical protein
LVGFFMVLMETMCFSAYLMSLTSFL